MDEKNLYYRKLIIIGNEVENVLKSIPNWQLVEAESSNQTITLKNEEKNVTVKFIYPEIGPFGWLLSTNVLPIDTSDDMYKIYEKGFDMSKNQMKIISDDILWSFCIDINRYINENNIDCYCGLVPAINDCNVRVK